MIRYEEIDVDKINELADMYTETFNSPPWNDKWTVEIVEKRLRQMILVEDFYGICAYEGETLCGMILGSKEQYFDGMNFNIKEFCVTNKIRGQGIGTKIFQEFEKRLKDMGVKKIVLFTLRAEQTERFYVKMGMETEEQIVFMKKEI